MSRGEMDGIETARRMRGVNEDVVILFISAHGDDETRRRAARAEPNGYLVKPLTNAQLLAAIEQAMKARQQRLSP